MKLGNIQAVLAAALAFHLGILQAASPGLGSPVIGTVLTKGSFRLDNATVSGNATLFEGGTIETAAASSSIQLTSGTQMTLGSSTRGKIFGDHIVLEHGDSRTGKSTGFHIEARGLRVIPETGNSSARVQVVAGNRVQVASLSGSLHVLNARGELVANLPAGVALAFEPQSAPSLARVTGCLENRNGHFLITDETTNVTVEVLGAGLDKEAGHHVEITGAADAAATPVSTASQLIRSNSVKRLQGGCGSGAAAAGVGGSRSSASSGTVISGTAVAIIGGAAAAALVGGLAAAGALDGGSSAVSR